MNLFYKKLFNYNTFKNTKKKIYLGIGSYRNEMMMMNEYEKKRNNYEW